MQFDNNNVRVHLKHLYNSSLFIQSSSSTSVTSWAVWLLRLPLLSLPGTGCASHQTSQQVHYTAWS